MSDWSELKRLAEAATQCSGPRRVVTDYNGVHQVLGDGSWKVLSAWHTPDGKGLANAQFAASASPAAILALIAKNERLEEDLVTFKGSISALGGACKNLTFCARTVTDGPHEALMAACEAAENALSLVGVSRAIDYIEGLKAENEALRGTSLYWVCAPGVGLARCVSDERYKKFSPSVRARYEPVIVKDSVAPDDIESMRLDAERYRWLRSNSLEVVSVSSRWVNDLDGEVDRLRSAQDARIKAWEAKQ